MVYKSDAPASKSDSTVTCPACGEALHLVKAAPAVASAPKEGPPKPNAASMPMNKLKDVIKAGSVA